MRKTNKKMIAIVLTLALIFGFCSTLICNISYAANQIIGFGGDATVQGTDTVKYVLNTKNVLIKLKNGENFVNLRVNQGNPVAEFEYDDANRNNYAFYVQSEDAVQLQIAGQNYLPNENGLINFQTITAEGIQVGGVSAYVPTTLEVQFDNATVSGNVITFTDDSTNPATVVTATVSPIEAGKASWDGNKLNIVESQLSNVKFKLSDAFDSSKMEVIINGANEYRQVLAVSGDNEVNLGGLNLPDGGIHFGIQKKGQNPGGNEPQFDGNAYFVWLDSNDKICYHKFTGLYGRPANENEGYKINYIPLADVTDQSTNNSAYVWGQDNANWVLAADMEDEHGATRTDLTKAYIFGDGIHEEGKDRRIEMGVQLDPTGAPKAENSIWSNADRNFRAAIYRDGYNAIEFSSNSNDYTYFPCFWDQTFFTSTLDISGTSKEKPAEYDTYLLESTISFKNGQFSGPITAVQALDINPDAVEITGPVDGTYNIKFKSNYYDNVVFKITAGGKDYFVKINRLVLDIKDNFGPDTKTPCLIARIFYDTSKSYSDFEVIATVIYNNGKTETKLLSPEELRFYDTDDHNREINGNKYALNGGKGLYESQCYIEVDNKNLVGAYFTIVKKGSLTVNGNTYGGTFSGSGEGTYYNAATRDIEL